MAVTFKDDWETKRFIGTSDKTKAQFVIEKEPNGYTFFKISMSVGRTSPELSGHYTTVNKAKEAVVAYENGMDLTQMVRADNKQKRIEDAEKTAKAG
jgi:hypothetical protein